MTDTAIRSNGRTPLPSAKSVGVSGVVQYGGIIWNQDYDRAWQGSERDKTITTMLNDPIIGAVLFGIEMLVRRVDWTVTPADDSPAAAELADFIQTCLDDMAVHWPGDTLAQVLTFLGWGWSCLEITHKLRQGEDATPASRYSDGKIGWHRWALRPQPTRYGWEFADDDAVALIQLDPQTFKKLTIPLNKCLLFRYASRDNSPEGSTSLRVAYDAWYFKRQIQKIEAIGIERDLAGLPIMYIPGVNIENQDAVYLAAQNVVTGIRNDSQSGAVIAGDRDENGNRLQELTLLSSGGQRSFDTDTVIKRYANEIVTTFLANVMRTGQDSTGSYALAQTQSGLFQQAIGAHLDTIGETIGEQAIMPLVRLNGFDDALTPSLTHGDIESADLARLGTYLLNLANAGILADTPELRVFVHEVAGLPVPTVDDLEAQAAADELKKEQAAERARAAFDSGQIPANPDFGNPATQQQQQGAPTA